MEGQEEKKVMKSAGMGYSGGVTIKLISNGKVTKVINQHNLGSADFFVFILNCIRGYNVPSERPFYMELYDKNFKSKVLNTGFPMTSNSLPQVLAHNEAGDYSQDKAMASFNAFIPDNFIAGKSFQGISITSYEGVEYARIALEDLIEITGKNTNVSIDWKLYLGNNGVFPTDEEDEV